MSPSSEQALAVLRGMACGHPGASSGEHAAWDILQNFSAGTPVNFADCLIRLDGDGRRAVITVFVDLASGRTGLSDLG